MQQAESIKLIEKGINSNEIQRWADLGCGSGTFTRALASLLLPGSVVLAVDKEQQDLPHFIQADFTKDVLDLGGLDGILMANSFHYVKDKLTLIGRFSPKAFLIVEYDTTRSNPWAPYPITYNDLEVLFNRLGYQTRQLALYPSRFGGTMYAALATASPR
jgi:trans-aconitate methyltransferase